MHKLTQIQKRILQICAMASFLCFLAYWTLSQDFSLGQVYQQVFFCGNFLGNVKNDTDVQKMMHEVRKELALLSEEPLRMEYEYSSSFSKEWFQPLMTQDELKTVLMETMKTTVLDTKNVKAYAVSFYGFRGYFQSMEQAAQFLNEVKEKADEDGQFCAQFSLENGQIDGIYQAQLVKSGQKDVSAGVSSVLQPQSQEMASQSQDYGAAGITELLLPFEGELETAFAGVSAILQPLAQTDAKEQDSSESGYEVGLLSMEFIENIEVYETYILQDEFTDVKTAVEEVTKEKETNKIYVVESGDVLSVIAMNHDTTASEIASLNGFSSTDAKIYPGQELIIAVPQPDLSLRTKVGVVYEEEYTTDPVIIKNDTWYTTEKVVHQEGTTGHRERNDIITYENGVETGRFLSKETILKEAVPSIIEQGTITPPTYIKPISGGHFTSGFGRRWGRIHKGVDWGCPVGTTVYASSAGTVVSAGYNGGYGNCVLISHPDGRLTRYAHNSKLLVKAGDVVKQGQSIALSGNTGRSTGPHVHFEMYINGAAVNPLDYIGT